MAKDDYFVITYRILAYLYECFKQGKMPNPGMYEPDALGINNGYWKNAMESLLSEGYITGIFLPNMGGGFGITFLELRITQKGIEFLHNSQMIKVRDFLKTFKETVPGF